MRFVAAEAGFLPPGPFTLLADMVIKARGEQHSRSFGIEQNWRTDTSAILQMKIDLWRGRPGQRAMAMKVFNARGHGCRQERKKRRV